MGVRKWIVAALLVPAFVAVHAQTPQPARKRVLALADTHTGYTHDSIGHALAVIDHLGRQSGLYDTYIRTDSQWITRQPIPRAGEKHQKPERLRRGVPVHFGRG